MKNNLKIVYFGTSDFSVSILQELLLAEIEPVLIVTAPDRPKGRGMEISPPPVKVWADEHNISTIQPEKLDEEVMGELTNTPPAGGWDLFIVAAYGGILPKRMLDIPKHKTLNVHPSLLPKFRGSSPIQTTILEDEKKTGVTIMLVDEEVDHGPIVAQASIELDELPKARELEALLAHEGGVLLAETIPLWTAGDITPEEQDHVAATYTKRITKENGLLDLNGDAHENFKKIKAYDGWPGTYFFTKDGKRVKVIDATYEDGKLTITRVIPEGRQETAYEDFVKTNDGA
tara:strand:+ start:2492 stop:3355 length:864 start_codon:yes stop_codon:yes gene_type:complete